VGGEVAGVDLGWLQIDGCADGVVIDSGGWAVLDHATLFGRGAGVGVRVDSDATVTITDSLVHGWDFALTHDETSMVSIEDSSLQ